ncbi:MAG: GGDEF domain-containing protein [Clostridia bacterium]|nr:GGDEF domain-containing protein [Clostridia bacterium]
MRQDTLGKLAVGHAELLSKISELYDAICLLDLELDSLFQIKYPVSTVQPLLEREIPLSVSLPAVVHAIVCPADQSSVLSFLRPERIRTAFSGIDDRQECEFLSQRDHWKRIVLLPLDYEDGVVRRVLYTHSDHTFSHRQYQSIVRESARLRQLSEHDKLTYLFNRTKLAEMLETEYRELSSCGVLFFDINSLKEVNDTLGHDAGDAMLCQFAESIRSITNHDVHAYRYGGDEFIVIVCNAQPPQLDQLLEMWRDRLNHLIRQSGIPCSAAVGRSFSRAPFVLDDLIRQADEVMYQNKRMMKNAAKA